jgi:large subunit ribosomal protein L29
VSGKSLRELRDLSTAELELKLKELREEVFNLRFRNSMRQLDNALKIRGARRDIARVMTLLGQNESAKGVTKR